MAVTTIAATIVIFLKIFLKAFLITFLKTLNLKILNLKILVILNLKILKTLIILVDLKTLIAAVKRILIIKKGGYITITVKYDISEREYYYTVG